MCVPFIGTVKQIVSHDYDDTFPCDSMFALRSAKIAPQALKYFNPFLKEIFKDWHYDYLSLKPSHTVSRVNSPASFVTYYNNTQNFQ